MDAGRSPELTRKRATSSLSFEDCSAPIAGKGMARQVVILHRPRWSRDGGCHENFLQAERAQLLRFPTSVQLSNVGATALLWLPLEERCLDIRSPLLFLLIDTSLDHRVLSRPLPTINNWQISRRSLLRREIEKLTRVLWVSSFKKFQMVVEAKAMTGCAYVREFSGGDRGMGAVKSFPGDS